MRADLACLREGRPVIIPEYDFTIHKRSNEQIRLEPTDIIIVEGLFLFLHKEIRELFDLRVFFDVPKSERFRRRLERDVVSRGRSRDEVLWRFTEHCESAYLNFILPSAQYADMEIALNDGFGPLYEQQVLKVVDQFKEEK